MELIINLTHDVLEYRKVEKQGTLKDGNLFGYREFSIAEYIDKFEIDFWNEDTSSYWSYECKFTDHGNRLVVTI